MKLREMDLGTLAAVKAGLTLDERHGTLLGNAEVLMYTAQIAPNHYFYAEFRSVDNVLRGTTIGVSVGVFRRPPDHMRRMIRAQYPGCRIIRDQAGLVGEEGDTVKPLEDESQARYDADADTYFAQDVAINEQFGPLFD